MSEGYCVKCKAKKLIADGEILLGDEPLKGDEVQRP